MESGGFCCDLCQSEGCDISRLLPGSRRMAVADSSKAWTPTRVCRVRESNLLYCGSKMHQHVMLL